MGKSIKNDRGFEVSRLLSQGSWRSALRLQATSRSTLGFWLSFAVPIMLFVVVSLSPSFLSLGHAAPNETTRVSVSSSGEQGILGSHFTSISADGRFVVFSSSASNLVPEDTNDSSDVFVHDLHAGTTVPLTDTTRWRLPRNLSISDDGRYVAYQSETIGVNNTLKSFSIYDQQTGNVVEVDADAEYARMSAQFGKVVMSADGRYLAYEVTIELDAGDPHSRTSRVYVHDLMDGSSKRVSGPINLLGGSYWPSLSADGRYVAFHSNEPNLVENDTNSTYDIFVYDQQTEETIRVSESSSGEQGTLPSFRSSISADGRFVAFSSSASNLVEGDSNDATDLFVHDRQTRSTTRVSVSSSGDEASGVNPSISADGRFVVFVSEDSNLVAGDTNESVDVFVHDRQTGTTSRVSVSGSGEEGDHQSESPMVSADGRFVVFLSVASNLVPGDSNGMRDVFVHERGGPVSSLQSLTVTRSGDGSGTVTSTVAGIHCGTDCSENYLSGNLVTLTASPTAGSAFTGWTGGTDWSGRSCSGTGMCTVVMTQAHTVTAIFTPIDGGGTALARYIQFVSHNGVNGNPWTSVAELTVLDQNGTPLDKSEWTLLSVDSEELVGENGAAVNAFDDNPATIWHTEWYGDGHIDVIIIDLGAVQSISGFRYLPRQDGGVNGRIAEYSFYGSPSRSRFGAALARGIFANTAAEQEVLFSGTRYVRLVADSEGNGNPWTSLAELTVLDGSGTSLDQSSWFLLSVDSQELVGENGAAVNAFDGNPASIWHTQWSGAAHPHEIIIDLGTVQTISGFGYLPRQDGGFNGRIAGYQFYGSLNGVTWGAPLAIGTLANTSAEQQVVFGGTRYVRLVADSEVNGNLFTTVAELTVLDATGTPLDKSGWTLQSVDSEELVGENGAAVNAFDGNSTTIWHTQWLGGTASHPHEIVIDLGAVQALSGFRYLPRQDGGTNGRIGEYQFYGSADGVTWGVPRSSGTFADTDQEQEVLF